MELCISCMNEMPEGGFDICPICGFSRSEYVPEKSLVPVGKLLDGRYYTGRTVYTDVFGASCIAYDKIMKRTVLVRQLIIDKDSLFYDIVTQDRKEYLSCQQERFMRVYQALASVDSPYTEKIYSVKPWGNRAYAVKKYQMPITLKSFISSSGSQSYDNSVRLMYPVIALIKRIHEKEIYHGMINALSCVSYGEGFVLREFPGARIAYKENAGSSDDISINKMQDIKSFLTVLLMLITGSEEPVMPLEASAMPGYQDIPADIRNFITDVICGRTEKDMVSASYVMKLLYGFGDAEVSGVRNSEYRISSSLEEIIRDKNINVTDYGASFDKV